MKLATLKDGSRDGQLAVVSRDGSLAHFATGIATRLQQLLDDWNFISPQLEDLYATLNGGKARHAFAFDARQCMAPLPRAHQWLAGEAADPSAVCAQPGGDGLLGGADPVPLADPAATLRPLPTLLAAVGEVAAGSAAGPALDSVRLLMLGCRWRLDGGETVATSVAPLALTPDELGADWHAGQVRGTLRLQRGSAAVAHVAVGGDDPSSGLGDCLAAAARARALHAGSLVGMGLGGAAEDDPDAAWGAGQTLRLALHAATAGEAFGAIATVVGPTGGPPLGDAAD